MGTADGAARILDALLVWLSYCALVLIPDLLFYFVFCRPAEMGTLPPVSLLALGAPASALTAALMAAMGKWQEWPRVRLSVS